ncbi:hypothetical protein ELI_3888 [Eubacterium callanderi]|uniref:Uncharacterized protein n=1 Tax=Eubacterium callanderi TaxID=53442 RepID=E3GGM7_9FIRM|nr:hypothetical protein ELI_3888 [Eubacterium callanderi]
MAGRPFAHDFFENGHCIVIYEPAGPAVPSGYLFICVIKYAP